MDNKKGKKLNSEANSICPICEHKDKYINFLIIDNTKLFNRSKYICPLCKIELVQKNERLYLWLGLLALFILMMDFIFEPFGTIWFLFGTPFSIFILGIIFILFLLLNKFNFIDFSSITLIKKR